MEKMENIYLSPAAFAKQAIAMLTNEKSNVFKVLQFPVDASFSVECCSPRCSRDEMLLEEDEIVRQEKEAMRRKLVFAPEGTPIPYGIPDLRPLLRRDGLILLSWKQMYTCPITYEIFWVARTGPAVHSPPCLFLRTTLGKPFPTKRKMSDLSMETGIISIIPTFTILSVGYASSPDHFSLRLRIQGQSISKKW